METCGNGNGNPWGSIQSVLSVAVDTVSVNEPLKVKFTKGIYTLLDCCLAESRTDIHFFFISNTGSLFGGGLFSNGEKFPYCK